MNTTLFQIGKSRGFGVAKIFTFQRSVVYPRDTNFKNIEAIAILTERLILARFKGLFRSN